MINDQSSLMAWFQIAQFYTAWLFNVRCIKMVNSLSKKGYLQRLLVQLV